MLFAQGPVAATASRFIIMSAAKPPRAAIHLSGLARLLNYDSLAHSPAPSDALPKRQKALGRRQQKEFEV